MISKNSQWLINWHNRMIMNFGHPKTGIDWCRKLAYYMGEEGNDSPSHAAIETAKLWELGKFPK